MTNQPSKFLLAKQQSLKVWDELKDKPGRESVVAVFLGAGELSRSWRISSVIFLKRNPCSDLVRWLSRRCCDLRGHTQQVKEGAESKGRKEKLGSQREWDSEKRGSCGGCRRRSRRRAQRELWGIKLAGSPEICSTKASAFLLGHVSAAAARECVGRERSNRTFVLEELAAVLAGELRNVIFREELQRLLQYGLRRRHCVHLRFRGAPAGEREREGSGVFVIVGG